MPLRRRIGIVAAAAVAIAVVLACAASYLVVRDQLRGQIDDSLKAELRAVQKGSLGTIIGALQVLPVNAGGPAPYIQIVASNGQPYRAIGNVQLPLGGVELPIDARTRAAARNQGQPYLSDVNAGGGPLRVITIPLRVQNGYQVATVAIQLARPLGGVDHILRKLRLILALVLFGGVVLAAILGRIAARRVLRPLAEVTRTAELIGETDDLTKRLVVREDDEVGQLATRFNTMLARLELSRDELDASVTAQRQLVADASHELRTPVTSLRTNVEVLLESEQLDPEDRRRLLTDVVEQSEELTGLVGDLIELARGDLPEGSAEDVRLDRVVEEAIERSRRNSPQLEIRTELAPVGIEGSPERLHRAINNLLDNAARHTDGGIVDVRVDDEGIHVRDHGGGIAEEDLPYLFDRFYRGASSRGRQGSGLGLAIVRQVAEQHGGSVSVVNADGGGASFTIHLPTSPAEHDDGHGDDPDALRDDGLQDEHRVETPHLF